MRTRRKQLGNVMWTWWEHQNKIMETSLEHGNIIGMWKLNMRTTSFLNTYSSTLKDYAIYCSTSEDYELSFKWYVQGISLAISLCRASNKNTYGDDRDCNTKHDRVSTGPVRPGGVDDGPSSRDFFLTSISRDNIFMAWDGDKTLMLKSMAWVQQLLDQFVECLLQSCEVQDEIRSKLRVSSSPRLDTVGSFLIKCWKYTPRLSEWVCAPFISWFSRHSKNRICHMTAILKNMKLSKN